MDEEEKLELERLRLRAAGQRANDAYEGMLNAPSNKVSIPSFGQPAPGVISAPEEMPSVQQVTPAGMNYNSSLFPDSNDVSVLSGPAFEGIFEGRPDAFPVKPPPSTPVTNVDLMGNPLREQPSVEEIRRRSDADRLGGDSIFYGNQQESNAVLKGALRGLGQGFMDIVKDPIQAISDATAFYSDPIANYMASAEGGLPEMIMDAIPNDINLPTLTKENLGEAGLTAMEFVSGKDIGKGGYDFNAQGGGNAFKTEGDRILKTSLDSLGGTTRTGGAGGTPLQQGQEGSPQSNFVNRMSSGQPLTDSEIASAREFASSEGFAFDPRTGYSAPSTVNQAITGNSNAVYSTDAQGRMRSFDSPEARQQNLANAQSAYDQASQARQMRIGGTGSFAGDSAAREARLRANQRQPGESQSSADTRVAQSRTQGSIAGGQLSQSDLRDLAQGSARDASTGQVARALEIQQRAGMGKFKPEAPKVDKLSQATTMVDRMITSGQLSPEKRNAAIQKIVGVGSTDGAAGSAGAGVMKSAEFDRVASQLQEGGSLYNMGIRVDPSRVDPNTGAALIYREDDGGFFGSSFETPVSRELTEQLLPYARSVRQGGTLTQDFTGIGMQMNQFAGSK